MRLAFWKSGGRPAVEPAPPAPSPRAEARGATVADLVRSSSPNLLTLFGWDDSITGEAVTVGRALGVPAVWSAVNFLARSLATLPVAIYEKNAGGRRNLDDHPLRAILNDAPNDEVSSFQWRFEQMIATGTEGRHVSFIERDGAGQVINLWPLETARLTVERRDGRLLYHYRDGIAPRTYGGSEVIDFGFMPGADRLQVRSPIAMNRDTIALAIAITRYGARYFSNGGVPPFAIEGPFDTPGGMARARDDLVRAFQEASDSGRNSIAIPTGHKIHELGANPEKMQMVEVKRFMVEEIARIYALPPIFLQDLTHGTFSNSEQQDLHLVKHTLSAWVKQWEQEINLKLFGRGPRSTYAEVNMDALMRGDFVSTMEGNARAIMTGQVTPNEVRRRRNLPDLPGGDELYIQGATVPLAQIRGDDDDETV